MATHYIQLTNAVTLKEIKAKFAAFELLYGKSSMVIRGTVNELFKVERQPVVLSAVFLGGNGATITKITSKRIYAETTHEGTVVIPFDAMRTGMERDRAAYPEIMFITKQ